MINNNQKNIIQNLSIDKSKWKLTKFGDVAIQKKQVIDRNATDLTKYIKGEHMNSNDVHIRQWGDLKDEYLGPAFTRKFNKGDILYGSRRTYLRKVSLAKFDGITSNTTFVVNANEEFLHPGLLPFIMLSEEFSQHSISFSRGSVNPYVNWKDLEKYEFLLPPKDQQEKISELLWVLDSLIDKEINVYLKSDISFKVFAKIIADNDNLYPNDVAMLKNLVNIKDNMRKPLNSKQRSQMKGEIPYYGANGLVDFLNEHIFNEDLVLIAEDGGNFSEFFKKSIAYKVKGKSWVNNHAHVLSVKDTDLISFDWLYYSLVHKNVMKYIVGGTRAKLNKGDLERIKLWVPEKKKQSSLISKIKKIQNVRSLFENKIHKSKKLQKSLINEIFS
jgi:type I restriction enzyme, S subunit